MNEIFLIKRILIFIIFWGIGLIFIWFRPKIEIFWKIIATLIFAFYIWFFYDEIMSGYKYFMAGWYIYSLHFLKELIALVFVNLFFIWPVALIIIFYKSDSIGSERLLKFLCILTLALWIVLIIYFMFSKGIDEFLLDNLKKMLPR